MSAVLVSLAAHRAARKSPAVIAMEAAEDCHRAAQEALHRAEGDAALARALVGPARLRSLCGDVL